MSQVVRTAGIDGCRAGWLAVCCSWRDGVAVDHQVRLLTHIDAVRELDPAPQSIALDIPIGLLSAPQPGGRDCDRAARVVLRPRGSCVFSPPARPLLSATHFDQVRGKGMTIQGFHIMPKIAEVDRWIDPDKQRLVWEAHPEVAFAQLAGASLLQPKRRSAGKQRRRRLLAPLFPGLATDLAAHGLSRAQAGVDDLLDAMVLNWSALRRLQGTALCLPPRPPLDERGLEMAIWA